MYNEMVGFNKKTTKAYDHLLEDLSDGLTDSDDSLIKKQEKGSFRIRQRIETEDSEKRIVVNFQAKENL